MSRNHSGECLPGVRERFLSRQPHPACRCPATLTLCTRILTRRRKSVLPVWSTPCTTSAFGFIRNTPRRRIGSFVRKEPWTQLSERTGSYLFRRTQKTSSNICFQVFSNGVEYDQLSFVTDLDLPRLRLL